MTDYKVGDQPWLAYYRHEEETRVPCPVCFGKCEVVVILGNGDHVTTPCDYCAKGFEAPRGWEFEYRPYAAAKQITVTGVEITETADGQERQYREYDMLDGSTHIYHAEDLFDTEAEAMGRAQEKAEAERIKRETLDFYLKGKAIKSFAWNVGYHRRETKRLKEQIERHERYAVLCKARAKTERAA